MARGRIFLFLFFTFSLHLPAQVADSLLQKLESSTGAERASVLNQISRSQRSLNTDTALYYAEEALAVAKKVWDQNQIAESYNNLGGVFYFKGDFHKAVSYFREALLIYRLLRNDEKEADMYNNLGVMHRNLGDLDKALDYYFQALELKEGSSDPNDKVGTLNNIGGIFYHQKNYGKAREYYEKVMEMAKASGNETLLAASCNNLSLVAIEDGDYRKAEELSLQALELRKKGGDTHQIGVVLNNLGRIYSATGQAEKAIKCFLQSIEKYRATGDVYSEAQSIMQTGSAYYEDGNFRVAESFHSRALSIARNSGYTVLERDASYNLALALNKLGRSGEAFRHLERYTVLHDSLNSLESIDRIAEMEAKFQNSEKQKEIELLKKKNEIRELENAKNQAMIGRQKTIGYSLGAGIFFVFVIAGLVYRGYRAKQKTNRELEERNSAILHQNTLIETHRNELALKNKEVTDSIRYAQRIQEAILPSAETMESLFPDSFVFFRPKDIVSGDFYWAESSADHCLVAAVDCTGHGVPGAFMSLVGHNLLKQAVNEHGLVKPGAILDELNRNLGATLRQQRTETVKDGMDIALCSYCRKSGILEYSGAFNPLYFVREGELSILKGDKFPIGEYLGGEKTFTTHSIQTRSGDVFYIFSDGYADQFGGPNGKKFKYSQLQKLLAEISLLPAAAMLERVSNAFSDWKGDMEQVDDVCLIGFRIP